MLFRSLTAVPTEKSTSLKPEYILMHDGMSLFQAVSTAKDGGTLEWVVVPLNGAEMNNFMQTISPNPALIENTNLNYSPEVVPHKIISGG